MEINEKHVGICGIVAAVLITLIISIASVEYGKVEYQHKNISANCGK